MKDKGMGDSRTLIVSMVRLSRQMPGKDLRNRTLVGDRNIFVGTARASRRNRLFPRIRIQKRTVTIPGIRVRARL